VRRSGLRLRARAWRLTLLTSAWASWGPAATRTRRSSRHLRATNPALARLEELAAEDRAHDDTVERMRGLYQSRRRRLKHGAGPSRTTATRTLAGLPAAGPRAAGGAAWGDRAAPQPGQDQQRHHGLHRARPRPGGLRVPDLGRLVSPSWTGVPGRGAAGGTVREDPAGGRGRSEPMGTVSPGFRGRRERPGPKLPPGQYLVEDFPVLSAGPRRGSTWTAGSSPSPTRPSSSTAGTGPPSGRCPPSPPRSTSTA
jgi:hypothetical protein